MNTRPKDKNLSNLNMFDKNLFRQIFENNPLAIAVIDSHGFIINSNHKWLELFEYEYNEMNTCHILDIMSDDDYVSIKMFHSLLIKKTGTGHFDGYFQKKNGEKIRAVIHTTLVTDSITGAFISIILYADTSKISSHDKIHKLSELKSHVLWEKSPIGIALYLKSQLLVANTEYAKMFGYNKPENLTGAKGFNHDVKSKKKLLTEQNLFVEQGLPDSNTYETICHRVDGSVFNVLINTVRFNLEGEYATLYFLQDISDRKRIENDLKLSNELLEDRIFKKTKEIILLNHKVINSQELERRRIAKDLHDGVVQSILAAKVNISISQGNPELYHDRLNQGMILLDQSVRELREICSDLFPSVLDEFGLASAIRLYSKYSIGSSGINIEFDLCEELNIRKESEINLYRIVQELFTNILKHSGADSVKISLERQDDYAVLTIEDNGIGFDFDRSLQSHDHNGLISIKQRAEGLGGILLIDSSLGMGSKFIVILK